MRPVVPKVRVGEILHGTRNLRHWLRLASTVRSMEDVRSAKEMGIVVGGSKKELHTPSKLDTFVVSSNMEPCFSVWGSNQNVVLLFINPHREFRGRLSNRMDPSLFSQWFTRSEDLQPDLRTWPSHAYTLWACLQMGCWGRDDSGVRFPFRPDSQREAFALHDGLNQVDRNRAAQGVKAAIGRGAVRAHNVMFTHADGELLRGFGPKLSDLAVMKRRLTELAQDPRVLAEAKKHFEAGPNLWLDKVFKLPPHT